MRLAVNIKPQLRSWIEHNLDREKFLSETCRKALLLRDAWRDAKLHLPLHVWLNGTKFGAPDAGVDMTFSFADLIAHAAWMDEPTRKEALLKLASFDPRVGHPIHYIDYAPMKVSRADPLANAVAAGHFQWNLRLARRHRRFPGLCRPRQCPRSVDRAGRSNRRR